MKKIVKILRWILTAFFTMFMVVGGISTLVFAIAALLIAPVDYLINLKKRFKIKPAITWILVIVLFCTGCLLAPGVNDQHDRQYTEDVADTQPSVQENVEKIDEEIILATENTEEQEITEQEITKQELIEEKEKLPENSTFSIRYLDMGQADATLIECDGHYMLIDGGRTSDSSKMYTVLKNDQIDYLDYVVGTHPDEDHVGGLAGALNYASAGTVFCSTTEHDTEAFIDFAKYAAQNGGGIVIPEAGDVYSLGSAQITILGVNGGELSNDTSIVLKVQYGETSFLFSGDAEGTAEEAILNSGMDLSATVLQVGHHGSADSTTEAFLNKIMPAYAIISVGEQNTYLHPTEEVLERLERAGVEIYRTDLQGEIKLVSDGKTVDISTEKEASVEELMLSGEAAAAIAQANAEAEARAKAEAEAKAKAEAEVKVQEEVKSNESTNVAVPTGTDYVLNTNTKKFHYPSCRSVKQMKAKNTAYYTGTRDEVIAKGYDSCGNCHP